jgi:hypothetical protein
MPRVSARGISLLAEGGWNGFKEKRAKELSPTCTSNGLSD